MREMERASILRRLFLTCTFSSLIRTRFTIFNELGHLDDITVTMVGDLKYGRTVHSLSYLLGFYNVKLNYVAPESLQMPQQFIDELSARGVKQAKSEELTGRHSEGHRHPLRHSYPAGALRDAGGVSQVQRRLRDRQGDRAEGKGDDGRRDGE